jgi:uncharacterized protein (TIGR03067 family)
MTKRIFACVLMSALIASCSPIDKSGENASDQDKMQGLWRAEEITLGRVLNREEVETFSLEIKGSKFELEGKLPRENSGVRFECTFHLDPTTNPKQIDLSCKAGGGEGIYKFEGDTLVICVGSKGGRPSSFEMKKPEVCEAYVLKREWSRTKSAGNEK